MPVNVIHCGVAVAGAGEHGPQRVAVHRVPLDLVVPPVEAGDDVEGDRRPHREGDAVAEQRRIAGPARRGGGGHAFRPFTDRGVPDCPNLARPQFGVRGEGFGAAGNGRGRHAPHRNATPPTSPVESIPPVTGLG